ncbi:MULTISPECIES: hypothetical protein [unclassified Rhodococcus (in: high G+C Gram-positive bacteria)]|uniref:hypothetical protein n=1 Tax=unclassified Rhodococcus (in: high G+C Gram-positive bacteria) TaxID=192944 RepID=UPI00163B40E7|nr:MULTISPECIES: hypothetical protein [unclassified Rhodococcus (in: high G+C Gram-positive bacteria)]MBC2643173.1 hypothetical protein [Rhodococcus sp. 3A]MBC2892086.1 hypothetical protein [Rhodococcus sp. 4CII]
MSETDRLGDDTIVTILNHVARGINPVLDLALTDPFGIKARTFGPTAEQRGAVEALLDGIAWILDTIQVPGTASWDEAGDDERARWWVTRIGAVNTLAVAFPGMFGVLVNRLPIQDVLGFANQAVVLVAVAREHGVTERSEQVDLLASVLCARETEARAALADAARRPASRDEQPLWRPFPLIDVLWRTARTVRALGNELDERPQPGPTSTLLGNIPVIGVVAGYLGERGALARAAKQGEKWIASRAALPAAVRVVR